MTEIVIFETDDHRVEVRLQSETLWVTQGQMAELFDTSSDNISLHLKNIYREQELNEPATAEDFSVVRMEGKRQVRRKLKHYNLDAIISVGYRVNSTQATRFRQWSTRVLREYLTQGYVLDKARFEKNALELEHALALIKKAAKSPELTGSAGRGLVDIVTRYTQTFLWLQRYDEGLLQEPASQSGGTLDTPDEAMAALGQLKQLLIERAEVDRYISWSGQALSYKMGGDQDSGVAGEV
ncbi:virulence RhuM family protein [Microbulbifer taiwanensis]|uniref:RhuM family protein n=1 Tax=Microbulbifer taiwanensis TaxID=986746 RepID=A0ABW1YMJ1_9GAMM|nr:RhuM family protein [Microbulbifer taiwanensis]